LIGKACHDKLTAYKQLTPPLVVLMQHYTLHNRVVPHPVPVSSLDTEGTRW